MPKPAVRIENPISGNGFTSPHKARSFVRRGRAVFTSDDRSSIRFVSKVRVCKPAVHEKTVAEIETIRGYDGIPDTFYASKYTRHIPLLMPHKALREKADSDEWSYRAATFRSIRKADDPERVAEIRGEARPVRRFALNGA